MASRSRERRAFLWGYRLRRWASYVPVVLLPPAPFVFLLLRNAWGGSIRFHSGWGAFAAFGSVVLVTVAARSALWWSKSRLLRRLQRHGYRVCLGCGYTLNPEHGGQPCPECGRTVDYYECEA